MSKLIVFIKLSGGAVIYFAAIIISNFIFPMSKELLVLPPAEAWFSIPSLFIAGFIYSVVILFTITYSRKSGIKFIFQLTAIIIGVNVILTQIETLYFQAAFPLITNREMAGLFIRGFLIHLMFVPLTIFLFNKKTVIQNKKYSWSSSWWKYSLAAFIYLPFYLGFGMLAQLSPSLQNEYTEWMMESRLIQLLPLWTLFRGILWTLLVFFIMDLFVERKKAIIAVILIFTVFVALSLIHPSVLMSRELRIVHFLEITCSMSLYGLFAAKLISKKEIEG
ncbi:MAG: hypothetical protein KAQ93_03615 [Spirochaetales bacterium]|nr:hypothetical protein [Spirochaetales bacterium]